jgi:hypothetical protein
MSQEVITCHKKRTSTDLLSYGFHNLELIMAPATITSNMSLYVPGTSESLQEGLARSVLCDERRRTSIGRRGLAGHSSVSFADPDGEHNLNIVAGTRNRFC